MTKKTNASAANENDRLSKSDKQGEVVEIKISDITVDQKYQVRALGLHEATVEEYSAVYKEAPDSMEPIRCVRIGGVLYLAAGFQRLKAAGRAGCETIRARVIDGDEKAAFREALSSNRHGRQLSGGDKKKAIRIAIKNFPGIKNTEIARMIGCSESYVRKVKDEQKSKDRTGAKGDEHGSDSERKSQEKTPPTPKAKTDKGKPPAKDAPGDKRCDEIGADRVEVLFNHIVDAVQAFSDDDKERFYGKVYGFLNEAGYIVDDDDESPDAKTDESDDGEDEFDDSDLDDDEVDDDDESNDEDEDD